MGSSLQELPMTGVLEESAPAKVLSHGGLPDHSPNDQSSSSLEEPTQPVQTNEGSPSGMLSQCELPDQLLEEQTTSMREEGTNKLDMEGMKSETEAGEESWEEIWDRQWHSPPKESGVEETGSKGETAVGPILSLLFGSKSSPAEEPSQEGRLVTELLFPSAKHVLSDSSSGVQKDRDLGRSPLRPSSPMKQGSPTKPPLGRRAIERSEKSPLSKPSEVKASQEWRRKTQKENLESPLPKYRSKGQKAGLKIAPQESPDRTPLAAMDLAMSQQMETQLHGDFYHLLGFSSPTEELRHAQGQLEERDREVAQLKEAVAELHSVRAECDALKTELEHTGQREHALREECTRGAHAVRRQIEEVALLRRDQAVFEVALGDADDRAALFEERAEKAEQAAQSLAQQLEQAEKHSAELQRELEALRLEAEAQEGEKQAVRAVKDELDKSEWRAKSLEGEVLVLTQQLEEEKAAKSKVERQVELAQEKLAEYGGEIQSLLENSEEMKESLEGSLAVMEERDNLTEKLDEMNAALMAALQEKEFVARKSLELKEQLHLAVEEREETSKLLEAEKAAREKMNGELLRMEAGLSEAAANVHKLSEALAALRGQKEQVETEVRTIRDELQDEQAWRVKAEAEVTALTHEVLVAQQLRASKAEDMEEKVQELTAICERTKAEAEALELALQLVSMERGEAERKREEARAHCTELTLLCGKKNAAFVHVKEQLDTERHIMTEMERAHEAEVFQREKMLQAALHKQFALELVAAAASEKMLEMDAELEGQLSARRATEDKLRKLSQLLTGERKSSEHVKEKVHELEGQLARQLGATLAQTERAQASDKGWEEAKCIAIARHKATEFALAEQFYAVLVTTAAEERIEGLQRELIAERNAGSHLRTQCKEVVAAQVELGERTKSAEIKEKELEERLCCVTAELEGEVKMLWSSAGFVRASQEDARASKEEVEVLQKKLEWAERSMEAEKEAQRVLTQKAEAVRNEEVQTAKTLGVRVEELERSVAEGTEKPAQAVAELEEARERERAFEQQIELEEQKAATLGADVESLRTSLAEKETENARRSEAVQAELERAREESTRAEATHRNEVEQLQARAQEQHAALKVEWEGKMSALEREIGRWTADMERAKKEKQALAERLEAAAQQYESEKADCAKVLASRQKTEANLLAALEAARSDVTTAQAALVSASEGHVAEVERLRAQLAAEHELWEQRRVEWQGQLQQAQRETPAALGQTAHTHSAVSEELGTLRAALEEAQREKQAAIALAGEQRVECCRAVAEKLGLTDQVRSAMDLARKLDARHKELVAATDLEAHVAAAELDTCQRQLKEAQEKAQALLEQLASREAALAVSHRTLAETEKEMRLLKERCEAAESKLKDCQTELASTTTALATSTSEKESLNQQLDDLQVAHLALKVRALEERQVAAQDMEARAQAATTAEAQAEGLREAMGKLSQERLAAIDTNTSLQAKLDEARAQAEAAQADMACLEKALVVTQVVSLGLAQATVRRAVVAGAAVWGAREAALHEKQRRERQAWEEAATRSEAEFAALREFSEVEAAVVGERAAELEAAVGQLREEGERMQACLHEATCHHQETIQQLAEARSGCASLQRELTSTLAAADMRRAGAVRALKEALAGASTCHAAGLAVVQCEVDQLLELQLSTAATALAREQQVEEVQRQLADAEGQLAALRGSLHETSDKEQELAAELSTCREEAKRLHEALARETERTKDLTRVTEAMDAQIVALQGQITETTEVAEQLRKHGAETAAGLEKTLQEKAALEGQLATCQDKLDELRATVNETERLLQEALQRLDASEQAADALREEVSAMAGAKEDVQRERAELEKRLTCESDRWAAREGELTESVRAAEQQARCAEEEKASMAQQVEDLRSMEETLTAALERKRREGAAAEVRLREVRERVTQLEGEARGLQARLGDAEMENKALKQVRDTVALEVATLTRERDTAMAAVAEKEAAMQAYEAKAAALVEDVMKLELDNDRLEDEVTRKSKELVARNREMMAVAAKMHKAHAEDKKRLLEDCNKRLAVKSVELQSAQSSVGTACAAKEECERKVGILVDNLRKAEREVERLGDECDGLNDLLVTVGEAFDYHTATLVQLKGMRALAGRIKKELQQSSSTT